MCTEDRITFLGQEIETSTNSGPLLINLDAFTLKKSKYTISTI